MFAFLRPERELALENIKITSNEYFYYIIEISEGQLGTKSINRSLLSFSAALFIQVYIDLLVSQRFLKVFEYKHLKRSENTM